MRGELETEQNCNILTPPPTLPAITAFLSRSPELLNRGPGVLIPAFSLQLIWTSCRRGYIIIWRPPTSCERHNSHSIQPFDSQGCPLISSTGCTCYLHWCISSFDSLAGVNMLQTCHNCSSPLTTLAGKLGRTIFSLLPVFGWKNVENLWSSNSGQFKNFSFFVFNLNLMWLRKTFI